MGATIKIVAENEMPDSVVEAPRAPLMLAVPPPPEPDARVDGLIKTVAEASLRLTALEQAVQGVPKAVGLMRVALLALSVRLLAFLALAGVLGLAAAEAFSPSWQILATLAIVIVGVFGPLMFVSYWSKS